jgi:hypothetical protein
MATQRFSIGRIAKAEYAESTKRLDLYFQDGTIRSYSPVPGEVFRRLCNAPNPTTYWEDRIAEDYPRVTGKVSNGADTAKKKLDDLFG